MNREMTLRNRFILTSYLSIVSSVVLMCVVSYVLLSSNSRKFAVQASNEAVQTKSGDINTKLQGLEMTLRDVIYSPELQQILSAGDLETREKLYPRESADHTISLATNSLYMMHNMVIFSLDGNMIGSMFEFDPDRKADSYPWYQTAMKSSGETVWLKDTVEVIRDNYGLHMSISGVKKIRSVYDSDGSRIGHDLGYAYFTMNLDSLLNFNQSEYISQGRKMFVVAGDARILGESDLRQRGSWFDESLLDYSRNNTYVSFDGREYLLTFDQTAPSVDWYTVCITERSYILKEAYAAIMSCVGVSIILLAVFCYISVHNAESLSHPIKRLQKEFEMVEEGNFNIQIKEKTGILEVDSLFSRFHVMAYRLDNLIHKVYEAQIKEQKLIVEARQAQLQSLQMQINPHFLYNTLDSINWMALMEGNEEVSRMILALGHLFRNSINTFGIYTTVREEIENVRLYMFLEQVRFEGRLDFQVEVSEGMMEGTLLKHTLQPLVENAIKHGIEPYHIKGKVCIAITGKDGRQRIVVSDNGKGMKDEMLSSLQQTWENIETAEETRSGACGGVGIRNIMKRLWLCYGKDASFVIASKAEEGTRMEIILPMHELVQETGKSDAE